MQAPNPRIVEIRQTVKIFISYTMQDRDVAMKLHAYLKDAGFSPWVFQGQFSGGNSLKELIKQQIEDCDFFVTVLSENSCTAPWVQAELWLALQTQKDRTEQTNSPPPAMQSPRIFGYVADSGGSNRIISLRRFDSEEPTPDSFSFGQVVNFDSRVYEDDQLASLLTPRVAFVGTDITDAEDLFRSHAFSTYEMMFPNPEERDDPNDICQWLNDEYGTETRTISPTAALPLQHQSEWGSVCAVLQVADISVGFAYLTANVKSGWIFGNYFCLHPCWRPHGRAKWFLEQIQNRIHADYPSAKAIVFEVEVFDSATIGRTLSKLRANRTDFDKSEQEQIRSVMRVGLYQRQNPGASLLLNFKARTPITYRQPGMKAPESTEIDIPQWMRANEWKLWLMIWPLKDLNNEPS
jgi:hypothetical protein